MPLESNLIGTQGEWQFDQEVTANFDDMLSRSIPQYDTMRQLTFDLSSQFVQRGTTILDLGCSRGNALKPFVDRFKADAMFVGLDVSEPMIEAARAQFADHESYVSIRNLDLRTDYPDVRASVTLCVLTLMFIPINHRQQIADRIYQHTVDGGCLILVEKLLGASAPTDRLMVERYHRMKAEQGYSQEEIDRKALALEGVQVPITAGWNEDMLYTAGFRHVECFWRWCNFAGWIAIRR
jgi:tRNA (cmo5U34)-methyltransferase